MTSPEHNPDLDDAPSPTAKTNEIENLLDNLKKCVKIVIEESVNRNFVHEESSAFISLCHAIDSCILHGIKRYNINLLIPNKTQALLSKISKSCPEAKHVLDKLPIFERFINTTHPNVNNIPQIPLFESLSDKSNIFSNEFSLFTNSTTARDNVQQCIDMEYMRQHRSFTSSLNRCLCIRAAIVERKILAIVKYLLENSAKYYESDSLFANTFHGNLFFNLISGICELEYSRLKGISNGWIDPPANELIDRQQIYSKEASSTTLLKSHPTLAHFNMLFRQFKTEQTICPGTTGKSNSLDNESGGLSTTGNLFTGFFQNRNKDRILLHCSNNIDHTGRFYAKSTNQKTASLIHQKKNVREDFFIHTAKEYVEWLHQNSHTELIFGKNNVLVNTEKGFMSGYLSLHLADVTSSNNFTSAKSNSKNVLLKWTPNRAVHISDSLTAKETPNEDYWKLAITVNMENIVYIHCHHKLDQDENVDQTQLNDSMILIRLDGVQLSPFFFPKASRSCFKHFLTSLEQGLAPDGYLDPSVANSETLPSQRTLQMAYKQKSYPNSISDIFLPFSRNKSEDEKSPAPSLDEEDIDKTDFLFRVVHKRAQADAKQNFFREFYNHNSEDLSMDASSLESAKSVDELCSSIRRQILLRTIRGWYDYYKTLKTMRIKLSKLIKSDCPYDVLCLDQPYPVTNGITKEMWISRHEPNSPLSSEHEFYRQIYFGGCDPQIRHNVWLTLLGIYPWKYADTEESDCHNEHLKEKYEKLLTEWMAVESMLDAESQIHPQTFNNQEFIDESANQRTADLNEFFSDIWSSIRRKVSSAKPPEMNGDLQRIHDEFNNPERPTDVQASDNNTMTLETQNTIDLTTEDYSDVERSNGRLDSDLVASVNVESSKSCNLENSFTYSAEIINAFAINIHRIDKDVARCDRNYEFFSEANPQVSDENLKKLRNIMATWVWEHMDVGYVQGMCDILAPILVIMRGNEHLSYAAFTKVMRWSVDNFPSAPANVDVKNMSSGTVSKTLLQETELDSSKPKKITGRKRYSRSDRASEATPNKEEVDEDDSDDKSKIDKYLENLNSLIEFLDPEVHQLMNRSCDNTYFYFCYRWFLLDFKREMKYSDIFKVWETIWAARMLITENFNLFLALALILFYRDNIICYNMDFTEIIKFFNERAEKHDADKILHIARNIIFQLQSWVNIDKKNSITTIATA